MAYIPTGILRQPYRLKVLLANQAIWQTLVGAATAAEAKQSICLFEADFNEPAPPRAIVMRGPDWERVGGEIALAFRPQGTVVLVLELVVPEYSDELRLDTREAQVCWFEDQVAAVMVALENAVNARAAVEGDAPFYFRSWSILEGPDRETTEEREVLDPEETTAPGHASATPLRTIWWVTLGLRT